MTDVERVTEAVLLYFSPSPWTIEKAGRWHELISGQESATSRALCDFCRAVRTANGLSLPEDWNC
jgi:hypothetical protein